MSSPSCLAECWTAMTSDINYNQQEGARYVKSGDLDFHARRNLIIKRTLLWWHARALMQEEGGG